MSPDAEAHCVTCTCGRRAPVQGCHGTVAWAEHLEAWERYAGLGHGDQSAERVAERGGFGYTEICELLGRSPQTWRPRGMQ